MTELVLLEQLKLFAEVHTGDLMLFVETKLSESEQLRAAEVHLMRLPDRISSTKKAPYIILQLVNGSDTQDSGQEQEGRCYIRIILCVYNKDASEGSLQLLNLITRLRIELLKQRVIGGQFSLRLPLEYVVYPDDISPYFMGEMSTEWEMPTIEREVKTWV